VRSTSTVSRHASFVELASGKAFAPLCRRLLAPMLVAAVLIGGYAAHLAQESPGAVIRHDLVRAGSAVARLPWSTPTERVGQTTSRYFPSHRATVDARGFPAYVSVTLHDLDRGACRDAYRIAGRIEGDVVIAIDSGDDAACGDRTAVTWRIMP
jgi:hypothetical protein